MNDSFKFVMPAEISKSEDGEWKIAGLASTDAVDRQGERIMQKGVDLTPIEQKQGFFNFDHDNSPENTIGAIDGYNQSQEGLYVHGRLFKNHTKAKAVYEIMSSLGKSDQGRVGLSVEGKVLERDKENPSVITKCQIKNVAVTLNPVNTNTYADIVKSMSGAAIDFDCHTNEHIEEEKELPSFTATQVLSIVEKALSAGAAGMKAPVDRSGGEAMAQSDMKAEGDEEKEDKIKEVVEDAKESSEKKKLKKCSKELVKSNIINILDRLQVLYPNNTRSEILEAVRDRLETKFPEIKEF